MRLLERANPEAPIRLGEGVVIRFGQISLSEPPKRTGKEITVPFARGIEHYTLADGKSCIFITPPSGNGSIFRVWFCGMDESPFLTQLKMDCFSAFVKDGEPGFYDSLKPPVIKRCEEHFNIKTKRQGDIYACELPGMTWDDVRNFGRMSSGQEPVMHEDPPDGSARVFRTNHAFIGPWTCINMFGWREVHIVSGKMSAPDHKELVLETPHILAQSVGVIEPQGD